jgi:predicted HTH domain antitoxin
MKMFNQIDKQTHPSRTLITGLSFNFANGLMDRPSKRIRLGKSLEEIQKEEQEIRDKEIQLLGEAETEQFVMDNILLSVAAELLDKEDEELEKENKTPTIKTKSMQKDKKRKRLEVYGLF